MLLDESSLSARPWFAGLSCSRAPDPPAPQRRPVVRLAELDIDPAQLAPYLAALREGGRDVDPRRAGVLTLYSVQVKGAPWRVRLFEMYADSNAYDAHIASPHFQKYKTGTAAMVRSARPPRDGPGGPGTKPTDRLRPYVAVE
jgi:quinol monooxygenase YgiN